jgi:hypothetical protein
MRTPFARRVSNKKGKLKDEKCKPHQQACVSKDDASDHSSAKREAGPGASRHSSAKRDEGVAGPAASKRVRVDPPPLATPEARDDVYDDSVYKDTPEGVARAAHPDNQQIVNQFTLLYEVYAASGDNGANHKKKNIA